MRPPESLAKLENLLGGRFHELLERFERCRNSAELERLPEFHRHREELQQIAETVVLEPRHGRDRQVKGALRAVHWNIERGKNLDGILERLTAHPYLRFADVLLVTETDIGMARSGNRHVVEEIAATLGYQYLFVNAYLCVSKGAREELKSTGRNLLGLHGLALFSRLPIRAFATVPLPTWLDKMRGGEKRLGQKRALIARLDDGRGGEFAVCCLHLEALSSPSQRKIQMQAVLKAIGEFVPETVPVLIGGDFNTTTYSVFNKKGLVPNGFLHLARGVRRSIEEDYRYPDRYYEKLFLELKAAGFNYDSYNESGEGTYIYDQNNPADRARILEHLHPLLFKILYQTLKPWGGRAGIKLDWFAGRGLRVLEAGQHCEGAFSSEPPKVIKDVDPPGDRLSDHLPIGVDLSIKEP